MNQRVSEEESFQVFDMYKSYVKKKNDLAFPPYYMLNIRHVAINQLYLEEKKRLCLPSWAPMEDIQRIGWELSLFHPDVVKRILDEAKKNVEFRNQWGHVYGWQASTGNQKGSSHEKK